MMQQFASPVQNSIEYMQISSSPGQN
jgi:hypothetical protein